MRAARGEGRLTAAPLPVGAAHAASHAHRTVTHPLDPQPEVQYQSTERVGESKLPLGCVY